MDVIREKPRLRKGLGAENMAVIRHGPSLRLP